jgi:hypothetical protein
MMATELALTKPDPTMDEHTLRVLMAAADRYVKSGLLPAEVNTPQKALVIMTAGRELGIPATYALRNIHVVKGKPSCSAELMLALVRRTYGPGAIRIGKTSNTACTVQYREQGWDGISEYTFTIEDAKQAGVTANGTWRSYPAAMLRARCISAVVRFAFPEAIAGLYTPEELGAEVEVSEDGAVTKVIEGTSSPVETAVLGLVPGPTPLLDDESARVQEEWAAASPPCNKQGFMVAWHTAVKRTRFDDDDTRHKFIEWYTDGATASLSAFLDGATTEEATDLIRTISEHIKKESAKPAEPATDVAS